MCVPENRAGSVCVCHMLMESIVIVDTYQLDLWAGEQLLWNSSFKPSQNGEWGRVGWGRAAGSTPGAGGI